MNTKVTVIEKCLPNINLRVGEVIYDSSTEEQYLVIDFNEDIVILQKLDVSDYVHKDYLGYSI
ncbi:hypothetical protein WEU38_10985 [Cyanobacterium aponinum AL20118]|uniref:Uncharacterized protein n=1 Tax=Cyanobacterium aponinum AL20115 TaxID=3090662 RepID=A0AAF0Z8C4_9CHRO|nr:MULTISPECIES: hypothetical protein [Cyanobacterium]WPF87336.1 hypothetical protein SAY89_11015 [Cyanobacterium aponinum AL20115]WVL00475.1 hypothetical protein Dongsha4_17785 [Cyanobacterium sp. Dongsha4]